MAAGRERAAAEEYPAIGFLGNSTAELEAHLVAAFLQGLRNLGYMEGQSVVVEFRWAEANYGRFPALLAELIAIE